MSDPNPHLIAEPADARCSGEHPAARTTILLATDDLDKCESMQQQLRQHYAVETVATADLLASARERQPNLILIDLVTVSHADRVRLHALHTDPRTRDIPVTLLVDRFNEADDYSADVDGYLTKPCSPRELLAQITSCLTIAQLRRESARALQASETAAAQTRHLLEMSLAASSAGMWVYDVRQKAAHW